jgi:GTP 3',8-cyclase
MPILANDRMRVIITGKCNLDCFYCHNEGQEKEDSFLHLRLLSLLVEALARGGIRAGEVTISGGEPLLHTDLAEIVYTVRQFADRVTMVSNGLLATRPTLEALVGSGLGKLRLGVDSLQVNKPRPSPGYLQSPFQLREVLAAAKSLDLPVDLNVVMTRFNRLELGALARFAVGNGLSIKFFEHVEVAGFGRDGRGGRMAPIPHVAFDEFVRAIESVFTHDVCFTRTEEFGEANVRCLIGDSEVRYCRYLCTYDLCWLTGTRVDALGYTYNCMVNRGIDRIPLGSDLDFVLHTLELATGRKCRELRREG